MADPSWLIQRVPVRLLVDHAGFATARAVLRHTLGHVILPPRARRALSRRVSGHLARCFPGLPTRERRRLVRGYLEHLSLRHAEDVLILALPSVARYIDLVDREVSFVGTEHWRRAMARPGGVLLVGSHVGSPALGTVALLTRYLPMAPQDRPVTRLCADPEMNRYPHVFQRIEEVWQHYEADIRLLITRRSPEIILSEMDRVLLEGGVVTTNLDVVMGGRSRRVFSLFGRIRLRLPALVAAARTALACGATILPWVNLRLPTGFRVVIEPPLGPFPRVPRNQLVAGHPDLEALCDRLAYRLERWIAAWPAQWSYWDRLHRRLIDEGS